MENKQFVKVYRFSTPRKMANDVSYDVSVPH